MEITSNGAVLPIKKDSLTLSPDELLVNRMNNAPITVSVILFGILFLMTFIVLSGKNMISVFYALENLNRMSFNK